MSSNSRLLLSASWVKSFIQSNERDCVVDFGDTGVVGRFGHAGVRVVETWVSNGVLEDLGRNVYVVLKTPDLSCFK